MSYLLDTNILLWARVQESSLPSFLIALLEDPDQAVYYSVINTWEISIKAMKGKLALPDDFFSALPTLGFECLPVENAHVDMLRLLPPFHADPFDRMLAAQASAEKLTLITSDKRLAEYPVKTLLVNA